MSETVSRGRDASRQADTQAAAGMSVPAGPDPGRARLRRAGLAAAALALTGLLATACGGGSSHARAGGGGGVEAALAYARCMRAHGVPDFPDPDSNGQFSPRPASSQETAAHQVCRHLLDAGSPPDAAQQHMLGQVLKYARCMRAHRISDFPDPNSQGQQQIAAQPGSDLDPHNPRFQAASRACQHYLPGGGQGGGS
jgi:hypothetical protein